LEHIRPKKSLGQNFLIDKIIAQKTVDCLEIDSNDIVLEIGPGEGSLTALMIQKAKKLYVVEIDERAIQLLNKKFKQFIPEKLEIIHSDILQFDFDYFYSQHKLSGKIKVLGNIPYYISSEIFFLLFNNSAKVSNAVLTVQKELGQRLSAKSRTKAYGILTLAREIVSDAKIMFDVPPTCFYPIPSVMSAVIKIDFYLENTVYSDNKVLMDLVKASFNQRRKVLKNSLTSYLKERNIYDSAIIHPDLTHYFSIRAEELLLKDYQNMLKILLELKQNVE
jgi:16S rRNA (adenine1518-N6/adenine1519-N6)-dimethyltransferase